MTVSPSRTTIQRIFLFFCVIAITTLAYFAGTSNSLGWIGQSSISPDAKSSHVFNRFSVHPFESTCKFPILHAMMPDIEDRHFTARIRGYDCPVIDDEWAVQDDEGYIWVNAHYAKFGRKAYIKDWWDRESGECYAYGHSGGLRPNSKEYETKELGVLVSYKRILINCDVFAIRCKDVNGRFVFERKFMGLRRLERELGEVVYVDDSPFVDDFGRNLNDKNESIAAESETVEAVSPPNSTIAPNSTINNQTTVTQDGKRRRLSIHILGYDSTARNQFVRHMVKSLPLMQKIGFEMFTGYNKVGDNSEPNILSLFAGDFAQAIKHPEKDNVTGDVNWNRVMPAAERLDADTIEFLWKYAKNQYNFTTMFNDDIGSRERGLFHYTPEQFQPGFTNPPADHYFRPYYLNFYKDVAKKHFHYCKDGKPIQYTFMDNWRRFATHYKDTPSFGFSFIASHSHDYPFNLEIMDTKLYDSLLKLQEEGVFENAAMIIFGDHGNRMSEIKYTYSGTIEERKPFFSISLPKWFREEYPDEYQNMLDNRFKLISNYDLHKSMRDIIDMNFGEKKTINTTTRGLSVFNKIPLNLTCTNCTIATNFCTCLVDRSNVTEPMPGTIVNRQQQLESSVTVLQEWLQNGTFTCFKPESAHAPFNVNILGIHPYVRAGIRKLENRTEFEGMMSERHDSEYQTIEFSVKLQTTRGSQFTLVTRVDHYIPHKSYRMHFEPMVIHEGDYCREKYMHKFCHCIDRSL